MFSLSSIAIKISSYQAGKIVIYYKCTYKLLCTYKCNYKLYLYIISV